MSWQERLVTTDTAKELYNRIEPILKERTEKGDESLYATFLYLEQEEQQKELLNLIKSRKNITDDEIAIKILEISLKNYD